MAVDHHCSYRPRAGQEHMHNRVAFHTQEFPYANMDGYERLIAFKTSPDAAQEKGRNLNRRKPSKFPRFLGRFDFSQSWCILNLGRRDVQRPQSTLRGWLRKRMPELGAFCCFRPRTWRTQRKNANLSSALSAVPAVRTMPGSLRPCGVAGSRTVPMRRYGFRGGVEAHGGAEGALACSVIPSAARNHAVILFRVSVQHAPRDKENTPCAETQFSRRLYGCVL